MKRIISFFATEHLLGNLLTILLVAIGVFSTAKIKRDIWPEVDFNVTTVVAFLGGASPEQVEKLLINPIESALKEVDGLKDTMATATESQAVHVLQIDPDARDADKTNADIESAVDGVRDFPDEVENPVVTAIEAHMSPVIEVSVKGSADPMVIRDTAKIIADELADLRGVAKVTKQGYRKKEYMVEAHSDKMAQRLVSLSDLINSISLKNISTPGGSAIKKDGTEVLVRTESQIQSVAELENMPIIANDAGEGTLVKDVASVKMGLAKPERLYKMNGDDAVILTVAKKKNGDVLTLVERVFEKMEDLKKILPQGIDIDYSNDFSIYLKNRLQALGSSLIVGLVLVVFILIFFLPLPVALVVAFGIPVAFLGAIAAAFFLGSSINIVSLIGLIIVLGMLVDDAIVVSENIWRHIEQKKKLVDAVRDGAFEVFGPVLTSILTTISAFAPMMFMTGIFGAFIYEIPLMVILALIFSLFEVFIVMPSHFTSWVGPFIKSYQANVKTETKNRFDSVVQKYLRYVAWSLKNRYKVLGGYFGAILLLFATGAFMFQTGRFVLFPPEGIEIFFVSVEAPNGTPLEETKELLNPIEKQIKELPEGEVKDFVSSIGIIQQEPNDPQTRRGSNFAHIRISLTPQHSRNRTAAEIVEALRESVGTPQGLEKVSYEFARQGPPQGQPIAFTITGQEFEGLRSFAKELKEEMAKIDGVIDIRDSYVPGKTEWQIYPRPVETLAAGLSSSEIAQSVRASFEGIVASSIRNLDEETDIRVSLVKEQLPPLQQLQNLKVGNRMGQLVNLNQIADFKPINTLSSILHFDFKRSINVSAEVDIKKITAFKANALLKPILEEKVAANPKFGIIWGGEDKDTAESMASLGYAFLFAAFFIFCLLIMTFKSVLQPILILSSIPLGILGAMYAMLLHGRPLSFMSMLGIIALAGVIVNNSIVLIDFYNKQKKSGLDTKEAIKSAAGIRLRPITLTTLTTVCGLLPTAYGETLRSVFGFGGGDPFIIPIALSLGWGLAFGTILVTLFFPALIHILDDAENLASRILAKRPRAEG